MARNRIFPGTRKEWYEGVLQFGIDNEPGTLSVTEAGALIFRSRHAPDWNNKHWPSDAWREVSASLQPAAYPCKFCGRTNDADIKECPSCGGSKLAEVT